MARLMQTSTKAIVCLVLLSLQSSFAAQQLLDVALCSTKLCYPKGNGLKVGKMSKSCPAGFELEVNAKGQDICVKRTLLDCPAGTTAKDGMCCGATSQKSCLPQLLTKHTGCPAGFTSMKDCESGAEAVAANATAAVAEEAVAVEEAPEEPSRRKLLTGGALFKEVNVVAPTVPVPHVILPKPAFQINMAAPKPVEQPKIHVPSVMMPHVILPKPFIEFTQPEGGMLSKVMPDIKFEGNPDIMPKIIPILPEPLFTVETPPLPKGPKVSVDQNVKHFTLDLSHLGPKNTAEINLPSMPNIIGEAVKVPDVDLFLPDTPKTIDLSSLGPKKTYNVQLPKIKLPKPGSLTVVNEGANEPQFIDLTGLGPKHRTAYNIRLPEIKTNGAVLNVIMADESANKTHETIVLPGHGGQHHTVINVPDKAWPEKKAHLTVDVTANPQLKAALEKPAVPVNITTVDIKMKDIDLSGLHKDRPDVVVNLKPLVKFNQSLPTKPVVTELVRKNITMKDIEIPRLLNDTTVVIKPMPLNLAKLSHALLPKAMLNAPMVNTTSTVTVINMPNNTLPDLPIPKGKIDTAFNLPIKLPFHNANGSDANIKVVYKEEWVNGNPVLPNPAAHVINKVGAMMNALGEAQCPTRCCKLAEGCTKQEVRVEVRPALVSCEAGCEYNAAANSCTCAKPLVADCPPLMKKCSIEGKGVCVPHVEGLKDLCPAFKAICTKENIFAKSCLV